MSAQTFFWSLGDTSVAVQLTASGDEGSARVGERAYAFRLLALDDRSGTIEINGRRLSFYWTRRKQALSLWLNGRYYHLVRQQSVREPSARSHDAGGSVVAPMPGTIVQLSVREGDGVAAHQPLLVMESMKMESVLRAAKPARVAKIDCKPGDVVEMGKVLIVLEAGDGEPAK